MKSLVPAERAGTGVSPVQRLEERKFKTSQNGHPTRWMAVLI